MQGLYKFRDFFQNYTDKYVLIGGTACTIIFNEIGEDFRATKDLDIVLIVENIDEEFGKAFWEFIREANYNGIETGEPQKQFYRFKKPEDTTYPQMIELFTRNPDIQLLSGAHLTPVHISGDVSSLSAILLNDDYYDFLLSGRQILDGFSVLGERYLIPFLLMLLSPSERIKLPEQLKADMQAFLDGIRQGDNKSGNINNDWLCKRLAEIYLSI